MTIQDSTVTDYGIEAFEGTLIMGFKGPKLQGETLALLVEVTQSFVDAVQLIDQTDDQEQQRHILESIRQTLAHTSSLTAAQS